MKTIIATIAMTMLTGAAHAANLETCVTRILSNCGLGEAVDSVRKVDKLDSSVTCKIAEQDGANFVAFFDRNDIVAYSLKTCDRHIGQNVGSSLSEEKVFEGRIFTATSEHKVIMIGKNACVYELLSSSGDSYKAVTGISVKDNQLVLEGTSAKLSNEQIEERIRKFETGSKKGLKQLSCKR